MESHKLVMPEHLNQYDFLFGGYLLKWVDEYAWIAASLDYPDTNFVTIGMDRVEFRKSIRGGTILTFQVEKVREGKTSVQYSVNVYRGNKGARDEILFSTTVAFVSIDNEGKKISLQEC